MSQIGADKPMSDVTTLWDSKLRRSTRERKPNVTVNENSVQLEKLRILRQRKGGYVSAFTHKRGELANLISWKVNADQASCKLIEIETSLDKLWSCHYEYQNLLRESGDHSEAAHTEKQKVYY